MFQTTSFIMMFPQAGTSSTGVVAVLLVLSFLFVSRWRTASLPYPPGPPPDPLIGNVRYVMLDTVDQLSAKLSEQYGDVTYLRLFGQHIVVLNTFEAAKDLLDRRSNIYSSRPRRIVTNELMGWGGIVVHMPMSQRWRKHRRLIQEQLIPRALVKYHSLQRKEVYTTLAHIGKSPNLLFDHLKRYAAGLIFNITYGYTVDSCDDEFVSIADKATTASVAMAPAMMLVDFFPILKYYPTWMPFSGFKRYALNTGILVSQLLDVPYKFLKAQIADGIASPSIGTDLLELLNSQTGSEGPEYKLDDADVRDVTGVVYAAATDTTNSILSTFILLMVLHPEVSKKVQAEIDQKTGNDRLVDLDDKEFLPYYNCVVKEVLRWACPVPLGIPHMVTEKDVYRGYLIPKHATIIPNIRAILRNEILFPEADKFIPERFEGRMHTEAAMQVDSVYGFGRRMCPGRWFADTNVWLLMVNILAIFSIEKALDSSGKPITPRGDYTAGYVSHPKEFPYKISYRSEKAKNLVAQANFLHN